MATWSGVITNAGNSVLNEWVNEKCLNFDGAAAGQGTVAEKAMMAQTALVSQKQTASLLGGEKVSTGIRLKIRITAPETAYTLNQYGVWASVTGGTSVMIAIFQIEDGIPIPSKAESPDFVYTFYALIMSSNTGSWTVNVDTSTSVTAEEMNAAIGKAAALKQDKLTGKQSQMVGFDSDGNAVAKDIPDPGVTSFNGRTGEVNPSSKDYTAQMVGAIPTSQKGAADGVAELDNSGAVPSEQMPGYAVTSGVCAMGQTCPGGHLSLENIQGNTVLSGTPAYDAPVSMESVEGPLKVRVAGKNLVDFSKATKTGTVNGVSYSIFDDGTISLSGVCDRPGGSAYIMPFGSGISRATYLPAGSYYLSGLNTDYSASKAVYLYLNCYNGAGEAIVEPKPAVYGPAGVGFTLPEGGAWVTINVAIKDGTDVTGVAITPQIEVGNEATDYEEPSGTTLEIPLIDADGQALEPLRMAYRGNSSTKTAYYDRIVRRNGVWCIERSVAERALTDAVWVTGSSYAAPYFGGSGLKDGATSYLPFCTHFPPRAGAAAGQDTGVWVGNILVVGNQALPNGASTTAEELKAFCTAQAEEGTPVRVCYVLAQPIYEELHQDVQVLLNTLAVPGGVCSVWFEGDVLPFGADIGLPRGDYPCSGVEGAYRWLAELSSPLPTPAQDDLYAWALEQQRGGVFATDGGVTTKNVPESGALTGILSVTEQGTDVSMIVFGPTGKLHTATRIAGVWRGWTTLYSPLSKPTPADLGAAAASHNHSADQITSGVLPLERGGLGASTWPEALKNLNAMACLATYYGTSTEPDINTILDPLFIVPIDYAKNCPLKGSWAFIMQVFYQIGGARVQIAFPFVTQSESGAFGGGMAVRIFNKASGNWSDWDAVYTAKSPPPVMTGATSSKAGTAGLVPAPAAGAQTKFLRGDGTWQTPYTHPSYTSRSSGLYKIAVDGTGHVSGAEATHTGRAARFVVGTITAGWAAEDCDYLCDGTSDQAEINDAIAALPSGGGEVLLLDGTYNISSSITISKAKVSLRGCGPATVIARKFNGASANGVISCSAANCTISSLAIDGNKAAYPNENNRGVYASQSAANIAVEDVVVQNSRDGIYLGGMTGGRITRCNITNSGAFGVFIYNATAIDISHNHIDATGETAVLINGGKSIKVDGNTITGSTNYGARLFNDAAMCALSSNICLDNAGGISLESASMCNVSDNLCMRGSGSPEDYDSTKITIRATSASSNNIIAGNLVMGKDVEDSGTGNLVVNNKFE